MGENILIWVIVAAVGLICVRWVSKTLTCPKGGGCGCGCATCPLRQGGDFPNFSPDKGSSLNQPD